TMDLSLLDTVPYFLTRWYGCVKKTPDRVMLVDGGTNETLTFSEVEQISGRIYSYLKRKGVAADDFVMIDMPRGIHMIPCMLGVWKAGAAFTVVEDDYAPDRIAYIRRDVRCKVFLDKALYDSMANEPYEEGYVEASDHSASFAVYTSGTTGFPKGVLHEYGNIKVNSLSSRSKDGRRVFPETRYAQISPFNFVASTKLVLSQVQIGYTMYVIPYDIVKNPIKLKQYFLDNKISAAFLSPSMIRIIGKDLGPDMKYVFTGSEPANGISLDGIGLVNTYSMSEGAFTLTQFVIDKPYDICPVGKPNNDTITLHLLDEAGNEVSDGEVGEIAFENPFLRGYINLPEETAKALRNGLYHTGDLGKKLPDGNLILVGRANDMIKINGNRIEPAEIEKSFKQATGASWCCAKGFEESDRSFICLYYTDRLAFDEKEMKEKLGESLPYYMIPSYYVHIGEVPLLPNGKVNKKALLSPDKKSYSVEYVAPTNDLERKLCDAAAKVLKQRRVGIEDDFFQLGGDSIATMAFLAEV
ncbi:non-ribosomal peptide synthetase, partial [Fibrobacter sp.]|uniref:non-ribosomal peptide synthetase n=1 Tax=Fibrobacter sp. TaxID=35828 RepID=UPI00389032BB